MGNGGEYELRIHPWIQNMTGREGDLFASSLKDSSTPRAISLSLNINYPLIQIIPDRTVLTDKEKELSEKYKEGAETLPYPTHWGGYRVVPR